MDAANKNYVDSQTALVKSDIGTELTKYLPKAGGIMSGSIDMGGKRILNVGTPSINNDAATKGYVDNAIADITPVDKYLPLSGGTMSGFINMGNNPISNVPLPTGDFYVANKRYVDNQIQDLHETVTQEVNLKTEGYLPTSGGTMTGDITFNTDGKIGTNDFGLGIQTSDTQNNIAFIGETVVHNEAALTTSSKPIFYRIESSTPVPGGATIKTYRLSGDGYQNMSFEGFNSVTFEHDAVVKEDLMFSPELNRPSRIIFNEDKGGMIEHLNAPVADTDAANKAYVDSKIDTSLFYNVNNLLFHITHISDNLYKCDCYTDLPVNIDINIINQGTKAQNAFSHPLEDFLIEKGFTFGGGNETFLQTVSLSSGVSAIISARLFNNNLVIYATVPQRVTSSLNVGLTLPISFLCSALISKNV